MLKSDSEKFIAASNILCRMAKVVDLDLSTHLEGYDTAFDALHEAIDELGSTAGDRALLTKAIEIVGQKLGAIK